MAGAVHHLERDRGDIEDPPVLHRDAPKRTHHRHLRLPSGMDPALPDPLADFGYHNRPRAHERARLLDPRQLPNEEGHHSHAHQIPRSRHPRQR